MQIRILLFGAEAAALTRPDVTVEVDPPTCRALREQLSSSYPALRGHLASARFAINNDFAAPDQVIQPGDEVALIGLVGGG